MQKNETGIKTKYAQNPRSMQQSEYLSVFFVCRKPPLIDEHEYRNGNNGHYFSEPNNHHQPHNEPQEEQPEPDPLDGSDELEK